VNATEVTAGLAESNGSLLPGLWRDSLHVTCGLTAVHWDQLQAQRSVTSMGKLYLFPSPSQSLGVVWKKLNLTQQKHAFTNQKKCTTTQNKHKKNYSQV